MRTDLVIPQYTKDAQRRAANPRASAWVSANAGAGKTKVLTDRVVRLLLDGCAPGRILCLTFTKAAAANMAIRVFELLGRWVTLDDESLIARIDRARRPRAEPRSGPPRAHAVRSRGRDAGRAQDRHHPRLLREAAASGAVRGQRAGAVRGAGREPERRDAGGGNRQRAGGFGERRLSASCMTRWRSSASRRRARN